MRNFIITKVLLIYFVGLYVVRIVLSAFFLVFSVQNENSAFIFSGLLAVIISILSLKIYDIVSNKNTVKPLIYLAIILGLLMGIYALISYHSVNNNWFSSMESILIFSKITFAESTYIILMIVLPILKKY